MRAVKGMDKIRNDAVREELQIEPIMKTDKKQHLTWFGNVMRMSDERQAVGKTNKVKHGTTS